MWEFNYDVSKKTKGIKGHPVEARWAGDYKIADNLHFKSKLNIGNDWIIENAWIHKVDDKLTVTASDELNLSNLVKDAKTGNLNFGVQFTYHL